MSGYLYLLECKNGALYAGTTSHLLKRYMDHLQGKGSKYCRSFQVNKLAVAWKFPVHQGALLSLELLIKKEKREKKLELVKEPALIARYLEGVGIDQAPDVITTEVFLREFCPCPKKGVCPYYGKCVECIAVHLKNGKKPPECFGPHKSWIMEMAKKYKLEKAELLEVWAKEDKNR